MPFVVRNLDQPPKRFTGGDDLEVTIDGQVLMIRRILESRPRPTRISDMTRLPLLIR